MISDKLVAVDLEIASTCNAACPVCVRRTRGVLNNFTQQMRTLADVKQIFEGLSGQINSLTLCGNLGDPMTCAEIVPICEWFTEQNPNVFISISTNGGIGTPAQYKALAKLGIQLIFGVDGNSEEILKLHRVNVSYKKVLANMNAYINNYDIDDHNGFSHNLTWQYILFEQNKTDLLPALLTAKQLGFRQFQIREPNGFAGNPDNAIPTYDFYTSEFTHWLTPVTDDFTQDIYHWWQIQDDDSYNKIFDILSNINPAIDKNGPMWNGAKWHKPVADEIVYTSEYSGTEKFVVDIPHYMTSQLDTYQSQTCYSLNYEDNSNLKEDALNVFISHDNYVYPCCIVGGAVTSAKTKLGYNNNEHIRELLNNISSYGLESFSLANTNLKEILNTGVLHTTYYDDIRNGNASTFCKLSCGKCSDTKKAYNPF